MRIIRRLTEAYKLPAVEGDPNVRVWMLEILYPFTLRAQVDYIAGESSADLKVRLNNAVKAKMSSEGLVEEDIE